MQKVGGNFFQATNGDAKNIVLNSKSAVQYKSQLNAEKKILAISLKEVQERMTPGQLLIACRTVLRGTPGKQGAIEMVKFNGSDTRLGKLGRKALHEVDEVINVVISKLPVQA